MYSRRASLRLSVHSADIPASHTDHSQKQHTLTLTHTRSLLLGHYLLSNTIFYSGGATYCAAL